MIFNEEIVGGRERVTTARGAGTARGLNRDQIVEIARLTGCKNFVGKRKKLIFKRSSFIVVLQSPCRDRAAVVASVSVGVVFHVFQEDAGCLSSICLLQQLDACPDGRMVLTKQCLKAPVPRFCEVVSAVCVVHGDVNVSVDGRESWSSCSVSRIHCATDISQIEIVDQRLC